jgi:C4-dicarboxylate transporter DctM subunit
MNTAVLLGSFFLLLFLGVPIAWSLGGAVMLYILTTGFLPMSPVGEWALKAMG